MTRRRAWGWRDERQRAGRGRVERRLARLVLRRVGFLRLASLRMIGVVVVFRALLVLRLAALGLLLPARSLSGQTADHRLIAVLMCVLRVVEWLLTRRANLRLSMCAHRVWGRRRLLAEMAMRRLGVVVLLFLSTGDRLFRRAV